VKIKSILSLLLTSVVLATFALAPARAEYPNKPVQFIVPWPPGDMEDVLTRMIAENFQTKYGQPAAVVNKPGGGGGPFPGAVVVAKAPADGSVVGSFVVGIPVVGSKVGIPELNPDPFEPVGIFLTYPFVLVASKDKPYKSMKELAVYAKDNKVVLGHFGAPLVPTKVTLALAKKMGFSYASDAAFDALDCNTLASGDVDVMNTTIQLVLPCLDKVNVLVSITNKRIPTAPDAPTISEVEPSLDIVLWNGLFVKKGTPQDVRDKLEAVAKETMMSKKAMDFAKKTGAQIYWKDKAASQAQIAKDIEIFGKVNALIAK